MSATPRVYVAGRGTFIGAALVRALHAEAQTDVVEGDPPHDDREQVDRFFALNRPDLVFVAAGRTAGIGGNQAAAAELMLDNLLVATHVVPAAWRHGVKKLLYVSSSCTYPKQAPQPMTPSSLWTGPLEPTSEPYAVAKLAGMTLCAAYRRQFGAPFITAIAGDAYGPGDDFSPENAHVVASLLRRIHGAAHAGSTSVDVWGSGTPRRDLIFVDDLADGCLFVMRHYDAPAPVNLGSGNETSIRELAETIRDVVGYKGELRFDQSKPDGMPRKGLDASVVRQLGWMPRRSLRQGLEQTYAAMLTANAVELR
jgi:GDP-L-fucose synthase